MLEFRGRHIERSARSREFQELFQRSLHQYLDPIFGFDIIQFDKDIATPKGISTSDWIKQKWDIKAEQLIRELIR